MNHFYLGELFALGVSLCDATCCSILNKAGKVTAVFSLNYVKLLFAATFLTLFRLVTTGQVIISGIPPLPLFFIMLSGIVGYIFADMFFFASYLYIPYRLSMVIYYANPIFTTLFAYLFWKQRILPIQIGGILLTIGGAVIALCCNDTRVDTVRYSKKKLGIIFALLGMVGQGASILLSSYALGLLGSLEGKSLICSQIRQLTAIAGYTLYGQIVKCWPRMATDLKQPYVIPQLAIGGLTGCAIGTTLLLQAVQYIPVGIATALSSISPIIAIPISIVFFGEKISLSEILGIFVTVVGIILLSI